MGSSKFNLSKIGTGLMNDSSKAVGSSFRIVNLSLDDLVSHPCLLYTSDAADE